MVAKYRLARIINALKNMPRTGWIQRGVPITYAETISAHLFDSAIICVELSSRLVKANYIDRDELYKASLLALVHDIHESVIGDLNKYVSMLIKDKKIEIEKEAFKHLELEYIYDLLNEYVDKKSKTTYLANICDKIATMLQAKIYMNNGFSNVSEIYESSINDLRDAINKYCGDHKKCSEIINLFVKKLVEEI